MGWHLYIQRPLANLLFYPTLMGHFVKPKWSNTSLSIESVKTRFTHKESTKVLWSYCKKIGDRVPVEFIIWGRLRHVVPGKSGYTPKLSNIVKNYTAPKRLSNTSVGWSPRNKHLLPWSQHPKWYMYMLWIWHNKCSIYGKVRTNENRKNIYGSNLVCNLLCNVIIFTIYHYWPSNHASRLV